MRVMYHNALLLLLVSLGLTAWARGARVLLLCAAELFALGAYISWFTGSPTLAIFTVGALGALLHWGVFSRLRTADATGDVLTTLAVGVLFRAGLTFAFGAYVLTHLTPEHTANTAHGAIVGLLWAAMWYLHAQTRLGAATRHAEQTRNAPKLELLWAGLGSGALATGGAYAALWLNLSPDMGLLFMLKALAAYALGRGKWGAVGVWVLAISAAQWALVRYAGLSPTLVTGMVFGAMVLGVLWQRIDKFKIR